jgi:hypothetical protein
MLKTKKIRQIRLNRMKGRGIQEVTIGNRANKAIWRNGAKCQVSNVLWSRIVTHNKFLTKRDARAHGGAFILGLKFGVPCAC